MTMEEETLLPYAPVILKLLKGVMYHDDKDWEILQTHLSKIRKYYANIGIELCYWEKDGFAYLTQPEKEEGERESLPRLTHRRPLSYNLTLLCLILREKLQNFDLSEISYKQSKCILSFEDILESLKPYLKEYNDEKKLRQDVQKLVEKAKNDLGFLKELSPNSEEYEIRPLIKAKIDSDTLLQLKEKLENYVNTL